MNKKRNWGLTGIIAVLPLMLAVCGIDPEPEFVSSEYIIPADEAQKKLNIEQPAHIRSHNEAVATARIDSGGIVIASTGRGGTVVYVGDSGGFCNSAQIEVDVDTAGGINVRIRQFEGGRVRAVVKRDIAIQGTAGSAISPAVVNLMMDNNDFAAVTTGMDASSWIRNLPAGLSADISYVQDGTHPHEVNLTVSGTPQSEYSGALEITIPAENSARGEEVFVETRSGARFNITGND